MPAYSITSSARASSVSGTAGRTHWRLTASHSATALLIVSSHNFVGRGWWADIVPVDVGVVDDLIEADVASAGPVAEQDIGNVIAVVVAETPPC
jgi:hypothetical protein